MEPSTSSEINLTLDLAGIHEALQDMNFYELKGLNENNLVSSVLHWYHNYTRYKQTIKV